MEFSGGLQISFLLSGSDNRIHLYKYVRLETLRLSASPTNESAGRQKISRTARKSLLTKYDYQLSS
jgi:hypothetical protein